MYSVVKDQDLESKIQNPYFSPRLLIKVRIRLGSLVLRNRCQQFEISSPISIPSREAGGDDRSRTCDPLNANQMLSQLSYIPIKLVAGTGFEPATFGL